LYWETGEDQKVAYTSFYKNGAVYSQNYESTSGTGYFSSMHFDLVYLDGVDDYIELYVYLDMAADKYIGFGTQSFMTIYKI
jgi:hypothetical protein